MSQQMDGSGVTSVIPASGFVICPPPYPTASPIKTVPGRTLKEDSSRFLKECHKGTRQEESNISCTGESGESVFCPSLGQFRL